MCMYQSVISYIFIAGIGAGIVHYCANTVIVHHFSAKWCPLALTIANSGSAISCLVFPPVLTACIQGYGWKTTFLVLSGTSAVGFFSAVCYLPQPKDIGNDSSHQTPNDGNFVCLFVCLFVFGWVFRRFQHFILVVSRKLVHLTSFSG